MLKIACVLKANGSKFYNPEWVYKLERSLKRNISTPFEFVCLSDVELNCNVIPLEDNVPGWWNKLQLFKPGLFTGETLYFDLDVVISKPLDNFIEKLRKSGDSFLMANEPPLGIYNSSIMYWKGDYSHLYKLYKINPEEHHLKYRSKYFIGDQAFIQDNVNSIKFLNEYTGKDFMLWTKDLNFTVTENTGLILFLGKRCKPHMIHNHQYIKEHWK